MADVGQQQAHRLSLATLRQGPFISATTHTVLQLGQRPQPGAFVLHLFSTQLWWICWKEQLAGEAFIIHIHSLMAVCIENAFQCEARQPAHDIY